MTKTKEKTKYGDDRNWNIRCSGVATIQNIIWQFMKKENTNDPQMAIIVISIYPSEPKTCK